MKSTKEIRNRESLRYFKMIENFLNSDSAITEISKIIEDFNIRRKLSIFQDIFEVNYDGDYKYGDIPKNKYTNLFKYLKEKINSRMKTLKFLKDQNLTKNHYYLVFPKKNKEVFKPLFIIYN